MSKQRTCFQPLPLLTSLLVALLPMVASAQSYSRTEVITYYDNTSKWVLGQVASRAVNGIVVESTTFSTTTAQPLTYSSYGRLQQTLTYNADGTVATVKDGNNNLTTLSSWKRGIPQSISHADGKARSVVVNDSGWITQVTNENGYATNYTYDAMGRLASIAYPTGDSTVWNTTTQVFQPVSAAEYGIPAGHWRQTVSTGNARRLTYYDALWRPLLTQEYDTANISGTQRFQRFSYDHEGRITFASYPGSNDALSLGNRTTYDALGRPVAATQDSELGVLTTTIEYLAGFKTRTTNPRGQQTTTSYMAWGQPTTDYPVAVEQPGGVYTDVARDVFGKPTAITQRNAASSVSVTRRYVYDAYQQLCKSIEPETGSTVMAYDNAGNLSWSASGQALPSASSCDTASVAGSQKVSRSYDARNRLTTLTFPDGNGNQNWTYMADGLPDTVTTWNEGGSTTVSNSYVYNRRRLLTGESQSQTAGQAVWSIGYGYNANGHLASLVYPAGLTVDYLPNALGQPTQAGTFATGVQYYPNGAMKQFTYGNGLVHTMTQNARQLPARSTDSGGVLDLAYAYDGNGNVASITDYTAAGRQTRSMGYDGRDRLTGVTSPLYPGGATYTYDVLDNVTRATVAGRDHVYWYDASNRLTNLLDGPGGPSVIGLGYDARSNANNKNGYLFVFDHGNRLRTALGTETYRYDAQGRRVRTSSTGGALYEMYSIDGKLLWQRDEQIGLRFQNVYPSRIRVASRWMLTGAGMGDPCRLILRKASPSRSPYAASIDTARGGDDDASDLARHADATGGLADDLRGVDHPGHSNVHGVLHPPQDARGAARPALRAWRRLGARDRWQGQGRAGSARMARSILSMTGIPCAPCSSPLP
ncbi:MULTISPECIES: RHS repeat domain-containing protein [Stenotrophomonas]|uniref:RHS repeat domain-containing protein n=1 Tax=Stenotrophomonas TaxID=40323 RepID=UPI0009E7BA77|nr:MULTISPECIES: RHS repeat domain-containing protein [Stenotrophomonas]